MRRSSAPKPPRTVQRELLRAMKRIRGVELAIEAEYPKDEMKTPVHLCIGQEAVPVGVCANLRQDDYVLSNHRSHGHYLAKGGDLKAMIAEFYCRETGCSRGHGGSMHLIDPAVGLLGSSSIVGGGVPLAVGAALASQRLGQDRVAVVFFGDAASEEGAFYESMNCARLWKLPVVFVCENNFYSVCSHIDARQHTREIVLRARAFDIPAAQVDGTDVLDVYRKAAAAVAHARRGKGPYFLECQAYRWRAHSGAGDPDAERYRKPGEAERWLKRCPIRLLEKRLLASGTVRPQDIQGMQERISAEIREAFRFAQAGPLPGPEALERHLFFSERAA
ncbi:MAG: thiamine pyrophosphate-dependent dehydrogenase E1 component subunit alpha [Elusimicrobia bacterium]|nr:thiamine pyrophosphate-dependent dehydrogenase E1 component subunit alpha [Elusimicrobiota bacterium]